MNQFILGKQHEQNIEIKVTAREDQLENWMDHNFN